MVEAALRDPATAPVREPVRAALAMLAALTDAPAAFGPGDVSPLRAAGVSDAAIEDAIAICALFSIIVRFADTLAFALPEALDPARLLEVGYAPAG